MGETLRRKGLANEPHPFRIDYPYYGLFRSADITPMYLNGERVYHCRLLNGEVVFLKKMAPDRHWIDARENTATPLSGIIGRSIDDFLQHA